MSMETSRCLSWWWLGRSWVGVEFVAMVESCGGGCWTWRRGGTGGRDVVAVVVVETWCLWTSGFGGAG